MSKTDIQSTFQIIPVYPHDWELLGMQWKGLYFFDTLLPFGLWSVPFLVSSESWNLKWYHVHEGCPIHPTRVDSSLVFAIRLTGNRFVNLIPSNRHESLPLLSIRHSGSQFARDLENIVDLDFEGGLKMLSIRLDSIEWTRIIQNE